MRGSFLQAILFEVVPPMVIVHGTGLLRMIPLCIFYLVIPGEAMGVTGLDALFASLLLPTTAYLGNLLPLHLAV